jgi:hypothetical protein
MVDVWLSSLLLDRMCTLALRVPLLAIRIFKHSVSICRMHILPRENMILERKRWGAKRRLHYVWAKVMGQSRKAFSRRAVTCGSSGNTETKGSAQASHAFHSWAERWQ